MGHKRLVAFIILIVFIFACNVSWVAACEDNTFQEQCFTDVPNDYWAKDAISAMVAKGIFSGYADGSFKPDQEITRAEFARIMVVSLSLPLKNAPQASFKDVSMGNWAFSYVETAKYYLTGFRYADGDYFEPSSPAVREDMAVALVKALGYAADGEAAGTLAGYTDNDQMSPNLVAYIASAIKNGIIQGYVTAGAKEFKPQKPLTRAEAAMLLYKVIQRGGQATKVTYEKDASNYVEEATRLEKPVQDSTYIVPVVSGAVDGSRIIVRWNKITDNRLQGYKVVVSKDNPRPQYPDDGYLYWITDRSRTSAVIDNSTAYNGGDFGRYLIAGQSYYISVTAVYSDRKVAGNAVSLVYPGRSVAPAGYAAPVVSGRVAGDHIVINWNAIDDSRLQGYKVVISRSNSRPKYPDDGYLYWITDISQTSAVVDNSSAYNGGDIDGYLNSGQNYYFSVTAVYSDKKVPGNTIQLRYP
ncbi:MAG: S-layer homology domain-containing protein [Candidatus Saccharibacteria bacterium]